MNRSETIGIVGAGHFGTALAKVAADSGRPALLWSKDETVAAEINRSHCNPRLADVSLAALVRATADPEELAHTARVIVITVDSIDVRGRARILGDVLDGSHLLVHAIGSLATPGDKRVSEVLIEETPVLRVGVLAGPALWRDLIDGQFASIVVASRFAELTAEVRRLLSAPPILRVYRGDDLIGAEFAAALSGAYTVAVGMSDQLGVGPGARAVLITRALAEAARLGEAVGAAPRTFSGLAGLGSLLVQASSEHSREYKLGRHLGSGNAVEESAFTEGARATLAVIRLAEKLEVRMPVLTSLAAVITGRMSPREAALAAADTVAARE